MIRFTIGQCEIQTHLQELKKFANDTYYRYHNSQRSKKVSIGDDKYPNVKVTGDIFSLQVWIKTQDGEEQRIFLDGDVFLNTVVVHTITLEGSRFSEEVVDEFTKVLKSLSKSGEGYIYAEIDKAPARFEKGKILEYPSLIDELYNALSEDAKKEHHLLHEALHEGFDKELEDF